eukprot:14720106-Ditylum_brightwellii.AAC.1
MAAGVPCAMPKLWYNKLLDDEVPWDQGGFVFTSATAIGQCSEGVDNKLVAAFGCTKVVSVQELRGDYSSKRGTHTKGV